MKVAVILVLGLVLAGCVSGEAKRYIGPNGRSAYYVECVSRAENCSPEAIRLCPTGYRITKLKSGLTLSWQAETKLTDQYEMLIECNE